MKRNSLKSKIIVTALSFTSVLLLITVLYVYLSERTVAYQSAEEYCSFKLEYFVNEIEKEIDGINYELTSLLTQLKLLPEKEDYYLSQNKKAEEVIHDFLLQEPYKYASLIFKQEAGESVLFSPVKLFTSKFTIIRKKNPETSDGRGGDYKTGFDAINNILSLERSNEIFFITAKIRTDYLFQEVFRKGAFDAHSNIVIVKDGTVLYSSDSDLFNRSVKEIFRTYNYNVKGKKISGVESNNDNVFAEGNLSDIFSCQVIILKDIGNELSDVNTKLYKILLFSIILIIIIYYLLKFTIDKIFNSIEATLNMIRKISDGDFSHRILIKRNDEIGLLIDSFNKMVEKLNESYHELKFINKELEDKIEELTLTRNELTQSQKMALIGETSSKISHELQNKVGGISIWLQNLEKNITRDELAGLHIKEMKKAISSFTCMLADFKKFYRKPVLSKSDTNLIDFLNKILLEHETYLLNNEILLKKKIENCDVMISIDVGLIEKAISNILLNAVQASPIGTTIEFSCCVLSDMVHIIIEDSGQGIPEERIDKIFLPFFSTKTEGGGLGLSIAHNAVTAHGGKIKVSNKESGGAVFEVILPQNKEWQE